jgi:hypothetical protein
MVLDGRFNSDETLQIALQNHQFRRELRDSKLYNKEGKDATYHAD